MPNDPTADRPETTWDVYGLDEDRERSAADPAPAPAPQTPPPRRSRRFAWGAGLVAVVALGGFLGGQAFQAPVRAPMVQVDPEDADRPAPESICEGNFFESDRLVTGEASVSSTGNWSPVTGYIPWSRCDGTQLWSAENNDWEDSVSLSPLSEEASTGGLDDAAERIVEMRIEQFSGRTARQRTLASRLYEIGPNTGWLRTVEVTFQPKVSGLSSTRIDVLVVPVGEDQVLALVTNVSNGDAERLREAAEIRRSLRIQR